MSNPRFIMRMSNPRRVHNRLDETTRSNTSRIIPSPNLNGLFFELTSNLFRPAVPSINHTNDLSLSHLQPKPPFPPFHRYNKISYILTTIKNTIHSTLTLTSIRLQTTTWPKSPRQPANTATSPSPVPTGSAHSIRTRVHALWLS
jgi:hypothetical protein